MKRVLLASTALVGMSLLAAPASADTVGSADGMSITLSGLFWFQASLLDESNPSARNGHGRGYKFKIPESQLFLDASNTADNGLRYGVSIELNANSDSSLAADEAYAFFESDDWGHVDIGDQDDVSNRTLIGAYQTHKGISGPFGSNGGLAPVFHSQHPDLLSRTDWQGATTHDATKISYFTPRFSGFQAGASFTPNAQSQGLSATVRDDSGVQETFGYGANYVTNLGDVRFALGGGGEFGEVKGSFAGDGTDFHRLNIWALGALVEYAGFSFGANYRDNGDSGIAEGRRALGADAGEYWAAGVGYQQGRWGISAWYSLGEQDNASNEAAGETSVERWGIGAGYSVAPGWDVRADWNEIYYENMVFTPFAISAEDNTSRAFILTNIFSF